VNGDSRDSSHSKWVQWFVGISIVGLLGTLLALDREHVSSTAHAALLKATAVEKENAVLRERLDSQLESIREDVAEIKEMLRDGGKR
jgi:hypothetical protein